MCRGAVQTRRRSTPVFDPKKRCVVLTGCAPVSGANYTAEVCAVLTALHAVPLDVPLVLLSDAESVLKVLARRIISATAWLRLGARSLMTPIRQLVAGRASLGFPLAYRHVESHTGGADAASLGNDLADKYADAARGRPSAPALTCESQYTYWQDRAGGDADFSNA